MYYRKEFRRIMMTVLGGPLAGKLIARLI